MKREVRAALAFAGVLTLALVALWLRDSPDARPERGASPAPSRAADATPLASAPASAPTPALDGPSAAPEHPQSSSPPARAAPRSAVESPGTSLPLTESDDALVGWVLAPDGSPVRTYVYAFQTGDEASLSYSEYGDETPTEVKALARALTQGQSGYLTAVMSDASGRFRLRRRKLGDVEVVLVAVSEEGTCGLRLPRGARRADLRLVARRPLRVTILSTRDLGAASLALLLGQAGHLAFPPPDRTDTSERLLPATLPETLRLELSQVGWASATRQVTRAEVEAGLVTWNLSPDLVDVRGRVLDPEGAPWRDGELSFRYLTERRIWSWSEVKTDAEGGFVCRGFPPGQEITVEVRGNATQAYYLASLRVSEAPVMIQLREPSVLRIKVDGSAEDVGDFGLQWILHRRVGETWQRLGAHLFGRLNRHFPELSEGGKKLDNHFALERGLNRVLGLAPGRYRISVGGVSFSSSVAEPVEVTLPPGGSASCVLKPRQKVITKVQGLVVHPGSDTAGLKVTISYEEENSSIKHFQSLDARGGFSLELHLERPVQAKLTLPELDLSVDVTLDPEAPDLGSVILE